MRFYFFNFVQFSADPTSHPGVATSFHFKYMANYQIIYPILQFRLGSLKFAVMFA